MVQFPWNFYLRKRSHLNNLRTTATDDEQAHALVWPANGPNFIFGTKTSLGTAKWSCLHTDTISTFRRPSFLFSISTYMRTILYTVMNNIIKRHLEQKKYNHKLN